MGQPDEGRSLVVLKAQAPFMESIIVQVDELGKDLQILGDYLCADNEL
jgi:hypothetical protein